MQIHIDAQHQRQRHGVAEQPLQLGHMFKVHAVTPAISVGTAINAACSVQEDNQLFLGRYTRGIRSIRHSTRFNRNALNTTDAELKLIASAAIIGDSNQPVNGYNTPAASGTPSAL